MVSCNKSTGVRNHFVLSPNLKIAKFYQRTEAINAHSVLYMLAVCVQYTAYVYIPRRGNIVSSLFILIGRLAMPKIRGRKAISLTSFFV